MKPKCILLLCMAILSCSSDDDNNTIPNQMVDPRDGQIYQLVTLGNQTWFAQNLNYEIENGESKCYNDIESNCFSYGRLYRGDDALTACPEGYHLASQEEWEELFEFLGGEDVAHAFLGPYGQQQGETIDFNLLAGGYYFGGYQFITETGYFWTSTDAGLPNSSRYIAYEPNISVGGGGASHGLLMSCRCIKD